MVKKHSFEPSFKVRFISESNCSLQGNMEVGRLNSPTGNDGNTGEITVKF